MPGQIDIIIAKKALAELNAAIKGLDLANDKVIELSKSVRELNINLSSIKTPGDLDKRLKKNADSQKKVEEAVKKVRLAEIKLAQDREKAFDKFEKAQQLANKSRIREAEAVTRNKLALDKQRKSMLETSRAYKKLSQDAVKARKNAQDLGAAYGVTSKRFKIAASEANKLNDRLKKIDAATGVYTRSVGNYGNALRGAAAFTRQMVSALGLMGGAFLAVQVIRNAAKTIKEFNKETAVLASVLQKSRKEIKGLIKNAKELGAVTAKTANEVVKLQVAYARLGFTQQEILDLTEATIEGSIAMNAELDATAELVGAVVNSMDELSTTDAPKIIDIMSLSTAKSALNFEKLNTVLPIVLGAANALNIPFTKVVATLGNLADSGIEASTSATALRNVFIESAKRGINYEVALEKIRNSQNKLTTANEIFGKRAAVSALIIAKNVTSIKELDEALQKAGGTAKRMADEQLDTLTGEITLASSAWDGFVLSIEDGEGSIAKSLRGIIKGVAGLFTALTNLNELTEIVSKGELISAGGGGVLGVPFLSAFIKNSAKASAQLQFLNEDFKELKKEGVEDLTHAYVFYEEKLTKALKTDKNYAKLLEFQLLRIEDLVIAKKKQIVIDERNEDILFEQKQGLIDLLLELDKNLKVRELEKKTIAELNNLLNKYNDEQDRLNKLLDGSIEALQEIIKANSEIINQTSDNSVRRRLLQENLLIREQIALLLAVPKAVKAIQNVSKVGILTVEQTKEKAEIKASVKRGRGTAQIGGTGTTAGDLEATIQGLEARKGTAAPSERIQEQIDFAKKQQSDILGQGIQDVTPTVFDVGGTNGFESALDEVTDFVDTYGASMQQAQDITNSIFDRNIANIDAEIAAEEEKFARKLELAEGNAQMTLNIERERDAVLAKLQKKKQKEQEKQFKLNQAIAAGGVAINTASAIVAALAPPPIGLGPVAGVPLAVTTGVLGAIQLGLILSQPVPKFAEGGDMDKDGLMMINDHRSGRQEFVERDGKILTTTSKNAIVQGFKGDKIHKDLESLQIDKGYDLDLINRAVVMTSLANDKESLNPNLLKLIFDTNYSKLEKTITKGLSKAKINNNINIQKSDQEHESYRESMSRWG